MVGSQLLEPTETFPVLVTARIVIITFVVGKPSKLAFATTTGKGGIGIHITKGLPTIPLSFNHRRTDQDMFSMFSINLIFVDSCAQLQPTFNNKYMIQQNMLKSQWYLIFTYLHHIRMNPCRGK